VSRHADEEAHLTPAQQLFRDLYVKINTPACAWEFWNRCLHADERQKIQGDLGDFYAAQRTLLTFGLYRRVHECSGEEAVCGAAVQLGFLTQPKYDWLMSEIGIGSFASEESFVAWVRNFDGLALVSGLQRAYWQGQCFDCGWTNNPRAWQFLWTLCLAGKRSAPIDSTKFESAEPSSLRNWKSRLLNHPEFPQDLREYFPNGVGGIYRITLSPERIRVLRVDMMERIVTQTITRR
jgi:hypothetical protein